MDIDLTRMPDGHLKERIEEIEECIRTDLRHLDYLKSELSKYWAELAGREKFD